VAEHDRDVAAPVADDDEIEEAVLVHVGGGDSRFLLDAALEADLGEESTVSLVEEETQVARVAIGDDEIEIAVPVDAEESIREASPTRINLRRNVPSPLPRRNGCSR
jgi:hypothetical protein